jgi:post-segregation antitoxin (ccd killing protein)
MSPKKKQPRLVKIDGRANPQHIKILKKHNVNISQLLRDAIEQAAKKLNEQD